MNAARVSPVLFLCLFAGQAGAIALSPVLAEVARDLDVSTATAGQLRTVAGLAAGITALGLGRLGTRVALSRQLIIGSLLLALGSLASAAATSFGLLAAAQVPVGAGIAILTTAGTLAAAEWVPAERRSATLSWALIGQPAAWIVGMPVLGVAGGQSWRYAWLVLPLTTALLAAAAVAAHGGGPKVSTAPPRMHVAFQARGMRRWLAAEMLVNTAWAGTLVYAGLLFVESYRVSSATTGGVLAVGAVAYVSGNLAFRHVVGRDPIRLLVRLAGVLAVATAIFGAFRPSLPASVTLFSVAAFAAGGRTLISSTFGLSIAPELRPAAMAMRAASMQFGYFTGSFAAGAALATGGYPAFGATTAALFVSSGIVLRTSRARADRVAPKKAMFELAPKGHLR